MERAGAAVITPGPPIDPDGPVGRLAELVTHLSDCPADLAVRAVQQALPAAADVAAMSTDERLTVVARALLIVQRALDLRDRHDRRARRTA